MTARNIYEDDVIVLRARDWQTADRIADAYTRSHGRVTFIAYGARHMKNPHSALVQQFTHARMQLSPGKKFDTLRQCELLAPLVESSDIEIVGYASFIAELAMELTPEREALEEIYLLLGAALCALKVRNPRLVALSFAAKLLVLCGVEPNFAQCVCCEKEIKGDAWVSAIQGGVVCADCKTGAEDQLSGSARELAFTLQELDFTASGGFTAKGRDLIQLERFLHKFIFVQTEKPLKSLQFLAGLPR